MHLSRVFHRLKWAGALPLLLLASHCFAGGGPAGFIVVYNPNDANSVTVANYYEQVRHIPERNMIPYPFPAGDYMDRNSAWALVQTLRNDIASRGLTNQFQGIALAGMMPEFPWAEGTGQQDSLQSFLYESPNYGQATYPPLSYSSTNNAYDLPSSFTPLGPAATHALTPNMTFNGQSYWPVSYVGYTGKSGITFSEALAYIDRAKSHDGTNAKGTIYWPTGYDIRSTARQPEIADCAPIWNARGLPYFIGAGTTIQNRSDIIGEITGDNGYTTQTVSKGNTYLPGAWVDNLTSVGGALNSLIPANSSPGAEPTLIPWIRAGVDGSSGAAAEPYADPQKFPHGHIHTHLAEGVSMVEAFWQSIQWPKEIVCFADPLLQPHAYFPVVTITSPTSGATVSGTQQISASATPTGGKVLASNLDLFIDGRLIGIGSPTETVSASRTSSGFQLDTTTLSDGWHELRVVAYNNDPIKTQGEQRITLNVNNNGQSVSFTGPASVNVTGTSTFTVTPQAIPDATSVIIQSNGRTIATLPTAGGTINVSGRLAPLGGNWLLYAIAQRANGQQVWSAPLSIPVTTTVLPAVATATPGTGLANIRFFANTGASNFNWDTTTPDAVSVYNGDVANGFPTPYFSITPTSTSFTTQLPWPATSDGTNYSTAPGLEASMWYYAPTTSWYEFGNFIGNPLYGNQDANIISLTVDGQAQPTWDSVYGPVYLAAGWHAVKVRVQVLNVYFSWQMYARGGASNDYVQFNPQTVAANGTNPNAIPVIASATATPQTVTGMTTQLQASASIGGSSSGLTYTWSVLSGPGSVAFSANGSAAASTTTATFTSAGTYVFLVQAVGSNGQAYAQTNGVTVQQTPSGVGIFTNYNIGGGTFDDAYAYSTDQFGAQMPVTPTVSGKPIYQWSSSAGGATFTPRSTNGDTVRIIFPDSSSAQNYTITATGTNGATGSATLGVSVSASSPPAAQNGGIYLSGIDSSTLQASFIAYFTDSNDPDGTYTNVQWSFTSQPPGSSATLNSSTDDYTASPTFATSSPLIPGKYTVQLSVTDATGAGFTESYNFAVNASGSVISPPAFPSFPTGPDTLSLTIGDTVTLDPTITTGNDPNATYQWQVSMDNGATWQNLAGQTGPTLTLGPLTAAQNNYQYQLLVTNLAGTVAQPGATVLDIQGLSGNGGVFVLDSANTIVTYAPPYYDPTTEVSESAGTLNLVVHRRGSTTGAVSVTYGISPGTATLGTNYLGVDGGTQITGTLNWADGDGADKTISIPIVNSPSITKDTLFYVYLDTASGTATVDSYSQFLQVTIRNNSDHLGTVVFSPATYSVYKNGGGAVTLNLQRTGSNIGTMDATYVTQDGSAIAGIDYTASSGTVTWANGDGSTKHITVPITQSTANTGPKSFSVIMSANTYSFINGFNYNLATVNILDLPYEQWVRQWWANLLPAQQPVFSTYAQAIQNTAPFVYFPMNEASGSTAAGINASGSIALVGAYTSISTSGTGAGGVQTPIISGSSSTNPGSPIVLNTASNYTVSFDLGNRPGLAPGGNSVVVNLLAGNVVVGTQTFAPQTAAPAGGWTNVSFTIPSSVLTSTYSALNGQPLSIQLLNTGALASQLSFTNLKVTSSVSGTIFSDDFSEFATQLKSGVSYTDSIPPYASASNTTAWQSLNATQSGPYFGVDTSTANGFTGNPSDTSSTVSVYVTGIGTAGAQAYALGNPGPQSPIYPGFSSTNAAATFSAAGSGQTLGLTGTSLPSYPNGADLNVGTLNGFSSHLLGGFSINAWVKTTTNNKVMALMGCNNLNSVTNFQVLFNENVFGQLAPDNILIYLRADNYFDSLYDSVPLTGLPTGKLSDGNWHQITIVVPYVSGNLNGTAAAFYFDGSPVSPLNELGTDNLQTTDTFASFNPGLPIGAVNEAGGQTDTFFNGSLDAISFYTTALTSSEVANLYQAAPPSPDPAVSAPAAVANTAGVANLLAYALGLDPLSPAQSTLPSASITNNYLNLNFPFQRSATDITYHVQASSDLKNWTDVWTSTGYQPAAGGSSLQLAVPDSVPVTSANQRFMRLHITQP